MDNFNIYGANREELIVMINKLNQNIQRNRAGLESIKELEKEICRLKEELQKKDSAVEALTHQIETLSEKSVGDEEAISVLIKQLEEYTARGASKVGDDGVMLARAVTTNAAAAHALHPSTKDRGSCSPVVAKPVKEASGSENALDAVTLFGRKNEEIAMLEMKLRELTEVNTFYAAIVSHHDEEERIRGVAERPSPREGSNDLASLDITSLHNRIRDLESERDTLQLMLQHQKTEKQTLSRELHDLRQELSSLELDLVVAERWSVEKAPVFCETPGCSTPHGRTSSTVEGGESTTSGKLSRVVAPTQYRGRGGGLAPSRSNGSRARSVSPAAEAYASPDGSVVSLLDLEALPAIRLHNPSKQEKLLWERLELYRQHIKQMQAYEMDRRRGFDEIERARAELFTEMNERVEVQRREIQELNKRIAMSTDLSGQRDVKKAVEHRSVKDEATSPVVHSVMLAHAEGGNCAPLLPSIAAEATLTTKEAFLAADSAVELGEHNDREECEAQMEEKLLQELLDPVLTSAEIWLGKHREVVCEEKYENVDDGIGVVGGDGQEGTGLDVMQTVELGKSSFAPPEDWVWQMLDVAEENARLDIACEAAEAVVGMLSWSHAVITAVAVESCKQAAAAVTKAGDLESALLDKRGSVSSPSGQEEELLAEATRLRKGMLSMLEGKKEVEHEEALLTTSNARFSTQLEALSAREPWKPLLFLCEAYGEVVDAHVALLRALSINEAADPSSDLCERVGSVLDVLMAQHADVSRGNSGGNGGEDSANAIEHESQTSTLLSPPFPPTPAAGDACHDYSVAVETPGSDANNPAVGSSVIAHESGSKTIPASRNTPSFAQGKHEAVTRSETPRFGVNTKDWILPDVLDCFMEMQRVGYKKNSHDHLSISATTTTTSGTVHDLFEAAPHPQPHQPEEEAETLTFIAEFDPFA